MRPLILFAAALLLAGQSAHGQSAQPQTDRAADKVWFLGLDGEQQGPMTTADVEKLIRSGRAKDDTLVWREGQRGWVPLRESSAFRALFVKPPPLPANKPPPLPAEKTPSSAAPSATRDIVGADPVSEPVEAPPSAAAPREPREPPAPPPRKEPRGMHLQQLRDLQDARERAESATGTFQQTVGVGLGATTVLLGGSAIAALITTTQAQDAPATAQPCALAACGLCVGGIAAGATTAGLSIWRFTEMKSAEDDFERAQAAASGGSMRY